MSVLVVLFGVVITLLGILGVVEPRRLTALLTATWQSRSGLYLAVAVRLGLGVALIAAAPGSRWPAPPSESGRRPGRGCP